MRLPDNLGNGEISGHIIREYVLDDEAQQEASEWIRELKELERLIPQLECLARQSRARLKGKKDCRPHIWRMCLVFDYGEKASQP